MYHPFGGSSHKDVAGEVEARTEDIDAYGCDGVANRLAEEVEARGEGIQAYNPCKVDYNRLAGEIQARDVTNQDGSATAKETEAKPKTIQAYNPLDPFHRLQYLDGEKEAKILDVYRPFGEKKYRSVNDEVEVTL